MHCEDSLDEEVIMMIFLCLLFLLGCKPNQVPDSAIELCKERGGLPEYKSTILAVWFECKGTSIP